LERNERAAGSRSTNALLVAIRAQLDAFQAGVWTALPAFVSSFNAGKATVSAQPTIQAQVRQPDGTWVNTTMPLCLDCPVVFPGGGGFVFTFPLASGDEGVLVFASRCIDNWWQKGGIQTQAELRMHDLSDGFFFPAGGLSQSKVPGNVSTNSCQLRSMDGSTVIELAANQIINVKAPGGVMFECPVVFQQGVTFEQQVGGIIGGGGTVNFGNALIMTTGDLQTGQIQSLNNHTHPTVTGGITGPPTAGS
jgi:hypothetical protein